jgi:sn-glycerol 3-phosphate transport system substrate-binding protein
MKNQNRLGALAASILMLTASLTGCAAGGAASQASGTGSATGTTELKYWYCYQDTVAKNNKDLTQKFNDTIGKEKGIHVTAEFQGGYSDMNAKLQSAFVGKVEPAVAVMEISSTKQFAKDGIIQPLDGAIPQSDLDDFFPGLLENSYVDKKLYAVPYLRSTPILYYNKTLFKKAGLDPEKAPANWDELVSMSQALAKIGVKGYGFVSDEWYSEAFIRCNGGDTTNAEQTEFTFNSPQGVEMQQFFRDGIKTGNFKYYSGVNGADSLNTDSTNQKIAMWCGSTGGVTNALQIAKEKGYEVGTAFIPKKVENKVPTGGANLVMTSRLQGEQKAAAEEFIRFMTSADSAVSSHITTGYLPTRKSIASDPKLTELYKETPQLKVALDQLQYASGRPMAQGYEEGITTTYLTAMDKIMTTDADIQTTLDAAKKKCDTLLK